MKPGSQKHFHLPCWITLVCLLLLSGCQRPTPTQPTSLPSTAVGHPAPQPDPVSTKTTPPLLPEQNSPENTQSPIESQVAPEPEEPASQEISLPEPPKMRPLYELEAHLDYALHTLVVDEKITYTNRSHAALKTLQLVVEAARYPGTFDLQAISDQAGKRIFSFHLKDTVLSVGLAEPLAPGESTQIQLEYLLTLGDSSTRPQIRPYPLGYTSLQANFGDWYPYLPPYDEEKGWAVHPPAMFGEHLVYDVSDYQVNIHLEGQKTGLVIAAGAPVSIEEGVYHFEMLASRSFSWSASPFYEVLTKTVDIGTAGHVTFASYHFPPQAEAAKSLLETMETSYSLYARLFGAAPGSYLASVQADFLDGMEYDSLYFLSTDYYNWHKPDTQEDFLIALGAHETAHQWWYKLVGNDQALEPWLDEALCTYSEALFFENTAPQALDWWWTWRVDHYEPQGWVDMSIYDAPQVAKEWRSYRDPVYLNGAHFIQDLRAAMGDEPFFAALQTYLQRFAYSQARREAFLEIMQQYSAVDIGDILKVYFKQ